MHLLDLRSAVRVCVSPQGSLPQQHPIKSINKSFNEIIYVEFWFRFPFPFMHPVQDQICINIACYWLLAGHLFPTYLPPLWSINAGVILNMEHRELTGLGH